MGLATGSIVLDVNCTTADDSTWCIPETTEPGTRPTLNIATKLVPAPVNATSVCTDNEEQYQSWKIENWLRTIEMEPGSSPTDAELLSDSGPSFSLTNMANGDVFSCTPGEKQNGTFVGACEPAEAAGTTADFLFDPKLNMLEISQRWECDDL